MIVQPTVLNGIVLDVSGAAVPLATLVVARGGQVLQTAEADALGRFSLSVAEAGPVEMRVAADGFSPLEIRVEVTRDASPLRLVLQPAGLTEAVTVTAARGTDPLAGASSTTVVSGAELLASPWGTIDDALRQTPGFSLFRRSSSRVANPTTQGVTLRGLAGSGASRTIVLWDGQPLNDAFGSWVYWNRVPLAAVERVEVMRGAAGDLYGEDALGGVIQVVSLDARAPRVRALADRATQDTTRMSGFAGGSVRRWSATAAGEWYRTGGAFVVAAADRGPVDVEATSEYRTLDMSLGRSFEAWRVLGRLSTSSEVRGNGTRLQQNDTNWRLWSGRAGGALAGGAWEARLGAGSQGYFQTFSAIASGRATERLTSDQRIPTRFRQGAVQWAWAWRAAAFIVGGEGRWTSAAPLERRYGPTGALTETTVTGGTETGGALFGRLSIAAASRLTLSIGTRADWWHVSPRERSLPDQSAVSVSPKATVTWRAAESWSMTASAYRASRSPSLNELFRGFRAGNVVTLPNAALKPERHAGVEGGALWHRGAASARVVAYWSTLGDGVTNVTLSTTPSQVTRQRQNTDTLRAAGVEAEVDWRPRPWLRLSSTAVLSRARFHSTPAQPALEGGTVPQSPSRQFAGALMLVDRRAGTLSAQVRHVGRQFDDDLNELVLDAYTLVGLSATRELTARLQATLTVENLFDRTYDFARTPVRSTGWPRSVRIGLRWLGP